MLHSFISALLRRWRVTKLRPPLADLKDPWQQLSQHVKSARMAEAQQLVAALSPEEQRRPAIRLCILQIQFHNQDQALYRSALNDLTESHPEFAPAWVDLGMSALKAERYAEAAQSLEKASTLLAPNARLLNNLGLALFRDGRLSDAVSTFEKSVEYDPTLDPAHFNLANSSLCLGDFERGWIEYEHRPV